MTDHFLLGDGAMHQHLCAVTEILGKFVANAPRPLNLSQLEDCTGRSSEELAQFCHALGRGGLLQAHTTLADSWELLCAPEEVTLEHVFRFVMADAPSPTAPLDEVPARRPQRLQRDADLLVMQAAMAINQSMLQHLRQFSLDRLKSSAAAVFPAAVQLRGIAQPA